MKKINNIIKILIALTIIDRKIKRHGFYKNYKEFVIKYQNTKEVVVTDALKVNNEIYEYISLLESICGWYLKSAKCMHKSFVLYKYLKENYGVDVNLIIGISNFPFEAHAWVEQLGHSLLDSDEDIKKYKIILNSKTTEVNI